MDTLRWFLFESTTALGIVLALVLFGLLVRWRRTLKARPLLIGLGVAAVLLAVQALVVTPRERVLDLMRIVERDVVEGRTNGLEAVLGRGFTAGDRNREAFLDFVHGEQQRIDVHSVRRSTTRVVEQRGDELTLRMQYGARITASSYTGSIASTWRITFAREGDAWRIVRIEPVRIGLMDVPTWDDFELIQR